MYVVNGGFDQFVTASSIVIPIPGVIDVGLRGDDVVGGTRADGVEDPLVVRRLVAHAGVDDDPAVVREDQVGSRVAAGRNGECGGSRGIVKPERGRARRTEVRHARAERE